MLTVDNSIVIKQIKKATTPDEIQEIIRKTYGETLEKSNNSITIPPSACRTVMSAVNKRLSEINSESSSRWAWERDTVAHEIADECTV